MLYHHIGRDHIEGAVLERQSFSIPNAGRSELSILSKVGGSEVAADEQWLSSDKIARAGADPAPVQAPAAAQVEPAGTPSDQFVQLTSVSILVILHVGEQPLHQLFVHRHGSPAHATYVT